MKEGVWTDERVAELKRRHAAGESFETIARAMGLSKNAVVGKAHRLGLEPRAPVVKLLPADPPRLPAWGDGPRGCRFPLWGNEPPTHQYCGARIHAPGEPYCTQHRERCWIGKPPVRLPGARKSLEERLALLDRMRRIREGRRAA